MKTETSITNSELSKLCKYPISKIRRNTKEFLPPDPQASRRSGYSRRFRLDDAFKVFVGTHLVSVLGYSFHEARIIIRDLWPWAESVALLPEKFKPRTGIDEGLKNYDVRIMSDSKNNFFYEICGEISERKTESSYPDPLRGQFKKETRQTCCYSLGPQGEYTDNPPDEESSEYLSSKLLRFRRLLSIFLRDVLSDDEYQKWLAERGFNEK